MYMQALPRMKDILVSESNPDFDVEASEVVKDAVRRAEDFSGVVERDPDWERRATPEQREARRLESLKKEKKADPEIEKTLDGQVRAKYKIQVHFVEGRKLHGPSLVGITIWESGKHFHGGGDAQLFFCKDHRPDHDEGCWSPIPPDYVQGSVAFCPNCRKRVNVDLLTNQRIFRNDTRVLAQRIVEIFHQLKGNADIYCKHELTSEQYKTMVREIGWDAIKGQRSLSIYPLKNIIKDTTDGADLVGRINAFLTS